MHKFHGGLIGVFMVAGAGVSHGGTTEWMSKSQLDSYANSRMTGKLYGTAIDCRDSSGEPQLKITYSAFPEGYKPLSGIKLFHRWNWLIVKSSNLNSAVAKLPRKSERQRKWRVVQQNSYLDATGVNTTCAIVYR